MKNLLQNCVAIVDGKIKIWVQIIICKCCLKMIDRDVNGGRNIYIKSKLK